MVWIGNHFLKPHKVKVTALLMCLQLVREGWSQYCTSVNRVGRCETENCKGPQGMTIPGGPLFSRHYRALPNPHCRSMRNELQCGDKLVPSPRSIILGVWLGNTHPTPVSFLCCCGFGETLSYAGRYSFRDHGFGDTHPQRDSIR